MKTTHFALALTSLLLASACQSSHRSTASAPAALSASNTSFAAADSNRNGVLSYKEYLTLTSLHEAEASRVLDRDRKVSTGSTELQSNLRAKFNAADANKDGVLSRSELNVR